MDALTLGAASLAGAAVGLVAGLVPALHANTLLPVAVAAAAAPSAPSWLDPALVAPALVALAVAHAFTSVLPQTYVGVPGPESLAALPAHAMVQAGRGREAVRACLDATLLGLVGAFALVLPVKWLLGEPGRLGDLPPWAGGALCLAAIAFLVLQESRRGLAAVVWAAVAMAISGALGLLAQRLTLDGWTALPPTPMLPLLGGLFGAAGLLESFLEGRALPTQARPVPAPLLLHRRLRLAALAGCAGAVWGALIPGLTAAAAASGTPAAKERDPRGALAALAAVAIAHQVYATTMLATTGQARTGLAIAVAATQPPGDWLAGAMPPALAALLAAAALAAVVGYLAARGLDAPVARLATRVRPRATAGVLLALLACLVAAVTGPIGLLLMAAAAAAGLVPLSVGVRRVHLTGALLVPALARSLG